MSSTMQAIIIGHAQLAGFHNPTIGQSMLKKKTKDVSENVVSYIFQSPTVKLNAIDMSIDRKYPAKHFQ